MVRRSARHKAQRGKSQPQIGQVRIIGGRWRGRKLPVADRPGLRPTGDRVRETLFNWLMPVLPGARCVDLFAGSGALGFEAASRGAGRVLLLELDRIAALQLEANRVTLGAANVEVVCADALAQLACCECADIVFVDPPFDSQVQDSVLADLVGRLQAGGWVYVEAPVDLSIAIPEIFAVHREKRFGDVAARLLRRSGSRSELESD